MLVKVTNFFNYTLDGRYCSLLGNFLPVPRKLGMIYFVIGRGIFENASNLRKNNILKFFRRRHCILILVLTMFDRNFIFRFNFRLFRIRIG